MNKKANHGCRGKLMESYNDKPTRLRVDGNKTTDFRHNSAVTIKAQELWAIKILPWLYSIYFYQSQNHLNANQGFNDVFID